jgi:methionyl-tRNA formyltransferase
VRVLLLSAYPDALAGAFAKAGDRVTVTEERLADDAPDADFIVSHGYRHILKPPLLDRFAGRIVNIHISLLPWNRGADPNFWSWFDATPKGVTLHGIDAGVDTGEILAQTEASFGAGETLRTSYARLQAIAAALFEASWPAVRVGALEGVVQVGPGSYHRTRDKAPWWDLLPLGHDTPVEVVEAMGREARLSAGGSQSGPTQSAHPRAGRDPDPMSPCSE